MLPWKEACCLSLLRQNGNGIEEIGRRRGGVSVDTNKSVVLFVGEFPKEKLVCFIGRVLC